MLPRKVWGVVLRWISYGAVLAIDEKLDASDMEYIRSALESYLLLNFSVYQIETTLLI